MAGLFSKKSRKDKEEKAAAAAASAKAAAATSTTVSAASATAPAPSSNSSSGPPGAVASAPGPPASSGSIASSTSNLPSNAKQAQAQQGYGHSPGPAQAQGQAQGQGHGHGQQHFRDNSSANNSITNINNSNPNTSNSHNNNSSNNVTTSAVLTSTASEYAAQQQHYGSSSKSSFDSDKARIYQYQQQQHANPHSQFSNSDNRVNHATNGPWISAEVTSINPFPRFSHTASYVQTGTDVYVFGGIVKGSMQKDMHVIDFQSLHCQTLPVVGDDSPPPTAGHTAVTLGQYIMYFGGKDSKNKCSDALFVLHTVRKEWNRPVIHGLLPAPRHSHAACVIGTTMYVFGGQFNGYYLNDIASFDMKSLNSPTRKWNRLEPASELPPARAGHCAAAHDGKVYIFGGADEQFFYNDIWCYDPRTNKWEAVPAFGVLPTSRQGHAASIVDDTMYIYGGMNHEDQLLGDLSAFKFNDRRWLTFPDTAESPSPRTEHAMCSVGDKIYILGGQLELNANDDAGSVYVLDTTKIRYHETSSTGSQRLAYDNDSALRLEVVQEDSVSTSFQRPTPSPDSIQRADDISASASASASNADYNQNHLHIQNQSHVNNLIHINNKSNNNSGPPNVPQAHFADDSIVGTHSQARISLDGHDSNSISRRRTTGKPTGFGLHEVEPRATQSVDEVRRPGTGSLENSHFDPRGVVPRPLNFNNGGQTSNQQQHQQQQQQDVSRRRSLDSRNRIPVNQAPIVLPRASLDQSARSVIAAEPQTHQQHLQQSYQQNHQDSSNSMYSSKDAEIKDLRQREQWLLAEVAIARKRMGERPLSLTVALKEDMGAFDADQDSKKYQIMQALLSVKAELERSKTSIVTQAQMASNKLREAERVRTAALQEAAYLKAKVSALQSGEVSSLASTETARAVDLEKRLTVALAQVDRLQSQSSQHDIILERERHSREAALERERQAAVRAEEAELSHTRSLAELATLHERASRAEASLRECEAKNAANEAGLSSYQQQSTALFSQISALKTTVDHQKKSLEKAKLAYSVANDRAEHVDRLWTQARQESDTTQLEFAGVRADLERAQREAEHWKAKAQDTDLLWQKAKNENEAMRTLLEEDMNASTYTPGANSRKHDSIMAITSASRVAELEHELGTLRHLLRESQAAAAQANKDLGDIMMRISQLEQTSMAARAESATAQRQLTASEDKVSSLEAQLSRKEEVLEEMAKEQENNEVQLGVLRGVMRENGLLADDLILEALSQGIDGKPTLPSVTTMTGLKTRIQELESQAHDAELQREELVAVKDHQEERIQQLEADYQTAVHYVQGSENMLQRLRDEAQGAKIERDTALARFEALEMEHGQCSIIRTSAGEAAAAATLQMEEEVAGLHRQLHESMGRSMELEQKMEEMSRALQESETALEISQAELKALKSKHHEHKKQGAIATEGYQAKIEQLEAAVEETQASLTETRQLLEASQHEMDQADEFSKSTGAELEDALAALKTSQESAAAAAALAKNAASARAVEQKAMDEEEQQRQIAAALSEAEEKRTAAYAAHQEELELVIDNAQKTIQELQSRTQDLEQQLLASENKISILLDNFQGPDSVRNSMASLGSGTDDLILRLMEANQHHMPTGIAAGSRTYLTPASRGSHLTDRSSADSLANELELLRSNYGQAQSTGTALRLGTASASASPTGGVEGAATASTSAGDSSTETGTSLGEETFTKTSVPPASSTTTGLNATTPTASTTSTAGTDTSTGGATSAAGGGNNSAVSVPAPVSSSSSSTLASSAQKLEEYEKMIEDMANARRQYEE